MSHSALRFASSLYNVPHLITQDSFDSIISYLKDRDDTQLIPRGDRSIGNEVGQLSSLPFDVDTKTAFLNIDGPMTYKPTGMEMLCGGASYLSLVEQMEQFVKLGAQRVIMDVRSPGGEAYGCFESANYIRQLADENGIQLLAYVDGQASSAAYGFSVVSHKLISNPDSKIGSIGVVVQLMNDNKRLEKEGITRSFVYAGEDKVPFDKDGEYRKEFLDSIQKDVNSLYKDFTQHVSRWMDVPEVNVIDTKAQSFSAKEALSIGLVDDVMTRMEFANWLADDSNWKFDNSTVINPDNDKQEKAMPIGSYFKRSAASKPEAKTTEGTLTMGFDEKQLAAMKEQMEAMTAQMQAMQSANAQAMAMVEEFKAKAHELEVEKQMKLDNERKACLSSVIGTAAMDSVFEATKVLDDAAFGKVVEAMKMSRAAETQGVMFQEVGAADAGMQAKEEMSELERESLALKKMIEKRNAKK